MFYRTCSGIEGLSYVLCRLTDLLNSVLPFLVALGVVYLTWGVVQYFIGDGDEAKKKGRDRIIFGIIGLAVIVSIWGLVALVKNTFINPSRDYGAPIDLDRLLPLSP